ncbi:hypothetical protein NDU88_003842 [Pleurodeles waltl]|uniref:Secreted protein n=1 Tax=Pleurodeles waltl TaxID=8319 RepID=A0AAV7TPT8_PLEWA|nr:hypothetical protein NDU88_003842 [Pleurodeles waltl]
MRPVPTVKSLWVITLRVVQWYLAACWVPLDSRRSVLASLDTPGSVTPDRRTALRAEHPSGPSSLTALTCCALGRLCLPRSASLRRSKPKSQSPHAPLRGPAVSVSIRS